MDQTRAQSNPAARTNTMNRAILPFMLDLDLAHHFASADADDRGAIFTRTEVVNFILDLAGYTIEKPLHTFRVLEPSFGKGDFLLPVVERLLLSYKSHASKNSRIILDLSDAIRAIEVHHASIRSAREALVSLFRAHGVSNEDAQALIGAWLIEADFLLVDLPITFTHAIGNPPYVRQELIPDRLMAEYRARYRTIYDRADLYIPFIERCLTSLQPGGTLAFICADRWMKNKYGGPLRSLVSERYHLAFYIDMVDTPAFHSEVSAYPAITVIRREAPGPTRIAHRPAIDQEALRSLSEAIRSKKPPQGSDVLEIHGVSNGSDPWILQSFDHLAVVRRLEMDFPLIEDAGCKIGIGVATGADRVFIRPFDSLHVEPDRKLPLATTKDIKSGNVAWKGLGVINPFSSNGALVDLAQYPLLARYLRNNQDVILRRNCAKKSPNNWYRTIDRIYPELARKPKLLIPDIKGGAHVVYEDGRLYPHHNLYHITSDEWDLKALQAVLLSGIAKLFVSTYSTKMRGGYLRFQAQYLRRIRLPLWKDVPLDIRKSLSEATRFGDMQACKQAVFALYRLTGKEREVIGALENI